MPDERHYYVICDDNCKFEGMTKEQIFAAIAEATGETPTHIDDAFITKIKEKNANKALSFWIGTTAEYNAIQNKSTNCFYIITDDTDEDDIDAEIAALRSSLAEFGESLTDLEGQHNSLNDWVWNVITPQLLVNQISVIATTHSTNSINTRIDACEANERHKVVHINAAITLLESLANNHETAIARISDFNSYKFDSDLYVVPIVAIYKGMSKPLYGYILNDGYIFIRNEIGVQIDANASVYIAGWYQTV